VKPGSLKGLICKIDVLHYLDRPIEYEKTAKTLLFKANDLLMQRRYDESLDAANWVLKTFDEDPQYSQIKFFGLLYKSKAALHLHRFAESLECVDMALTMDPNSLLALCCKNEALLFIVDILIKQNKLIEALHHIDFVLTFNPTSLPALERKFNILKKLDQLPAAAEIGSRAIAICHADLKAWVEESTATDPSKSNAKYEKLTTHQAKWTMMMDQLQKEMEAMQQLEDEMQAIQELEEGKTWIEEGERLQKEKEAKNEALAMSWLIKKDD